MDTAPSALLNKGASAEERGPSSRVGETVPRIGLQARGQGPAPVCLSENRSAAATSNFSSETQTVYNIL